MPADTDRARERDCLLDRLHNLRVIVPVLAQELASARRQAAHLRRENDRLIKQVHQLQRRRALVSDTGLRSRARAAARAASANATRRASSSASDLPAQLRDRDVVAEPLDLLAGTGTQPVPGGVQSASGHR